jgi:hypothetical protein
MANNRLHRDSGQRAALTRAPGRWPKWHGLLTKCIVGSTFRVSTGGTSNVKDSKDHSYL